MRPTRFRFTLRRMMLAVAIAAGGLAIAQPPDLIPSKFELVVGPRILESSLYLPSPVGADGRERLYTKEEWAALIAKMYSPEVLDTALADPRIARLPYFASSPSKRATLARCYSIKVGFCSADAMPGRAYNSAVIYVRAPVANLAAYQAITDAILARGPVGIENLGDAYGQFPERSQEVAPVGFPWRCDRKTFGVLTTTLLTILLVLCLPWAGRKG